MRGRPDLLEQRRRTREFVRVLAATGSVTVATKQSGMHASRVVKLLDTPEVRAVLAASEQAA